MAPQPRVELKTARSLRFKVHGLILHKAHRSEGEVVEIWNLDLVAVLRFTFSKWGPTKSNFDFDFYPFACLGDLKR
jgi:hypothetical protein